MSYPTELSSTKFPHLFWGGEVRELVVDFWMVNSQEVREEFQQNPGTLRAQQQGTRT